MRSDAIRQAARLAAMAIFPLQSAALWFVLMSIGTVAHADAEADIQRALLERQQRTDELVLRMQQAQPAPGNLRQQQQLDGLHLQNLQRLQSLNAQQLRQFDATRQMPPADANAGRTQMLQQQQQFERERQLELQQLRWGEQRMRDAQRQPAPSARAPGSAPRD